MIATRARVLPVALVLVASVACGSDQAARLLEVPECPLTPTDNYWHAAITDLPEHPRSADWVAAVGADTTVHPDFGAGTFDGGPIGIPYTVVDESVVPVEVAFEFADESDPGPYPVPADPLIEGGPQGDGDRHVLLVDSSDCTLYELFDARANAGGGWSAGSGAIFDLQTNNLRPDGWTSADAAGLPILPGLVRYDEVAAGEVDHAIRMTAPRTDQSYVWPARHQAGAAEDPTLPPMGARFRLDAAIDPGTFPEQARPIIVALQTHGAILADNGSAWFLSGVPDERWDNEALRSLRDIPGSAFRAVDTADLIVDSDSAAVADAGGVPPGRSTGRLAGADRIGTAVAISQAQFVEGAATVYLANAEVIVDAVAGGVLTGGPILLVPPCGRLPDVVAAEILRLDATSIVALGGQSAVCEPMLEQARDV